MVFTAADNNLTFTGTGGGFNGVINLDDLDGGGTGTNQTAAQVPVTLAATNYTAATQDVEAHLAGINTALASAGTAQNLSQVLATGTSARNLQIADLAEPTLDQDAATKAYVDATVASGGTLTDGSILIGGTGDAAQQLVISGDATMDNAGVLTIEDEVIESANILDGTIDLADLGDMGATANGEILQWDITANAGAGGWTIADNSGGHTGTAKSIFFADENGAPITADDNDNPNDDVGLIWDTDARPFGPNSYGALYVGRQADSPPAGNFAKVVLSERIFNSHPQAGLAFPLQIQNESGQVGSSTGILFAVDIGGSHGKGSLVYERQGPWGVGDFHFLQNQIGDNTIPTIADKAFTIQNDGDIQLYGNVIAQNGPGAVGQVLTTDASGQTVWGTGGGSGTDEQNIEGSVLTDQLLTIGIENGTGQDVDLSSFATEVELAAAVAASAALDGDIDHQNEIELPTGGASGNVLSTDGAGVYSWIAATGGLSAVNASTSFTGDGTTGSPLDIANDVIGTDELAINAVFEENIVDGAVTTDKIGQNVVTPDNIQESANTNDVLTTDSSGDVVWAAVSGTNLSTADLIQTSGQNRTYDLNGSNLFFDGTGLIGIGTTTPSNKLHVAGEIRAEGINSAGGTVEFSSL
ncbi:hypothetical protein ACU8V7_17680 [Zobellia nedashkovskayae]